MTQHHSDNDPARLNRTEARGSVDVKPMKWVLIGGILLTLIFFIIAALVWNA